MSVGRIESGSSLGLYRTCPRRYYYQIELGLEPKTYNTSLAYGSLIHARIADINSKDLPSEARAVVLKENEELYKSCLEQNEANQEQVKYDFEMAKEVSARWEKYWSNQTTSLSTANLRFIDVEKEWSIKLANGTHVGKRDGLVEQKQWGKVFLYELKTASSAINEEDYIRRLRIDSQISANMLALIEAGIPVAGAIYDIIWKPGIRLKTKRKNLPDETLSEFMTRSLEEYDNSPDSFFRRVHLERTPEQIKSYRDEVEAQFKIIEETKLRFKNTNSCNAFMKMCPFFDLCDSDGKNPALFENFKKRDKKLAEIKGDLS